MTGLTRPFALGLRHWLALSLLATPTLSTLTLLSTTLCSVAAPAQPAGEAIVSPEQRGDSLAQQRRYVEAIAAYREAGAASPVVLNKLGMAYQHLFSLELARRSYEQALVLKPRYSEALNNLGTVCYAEQDYRTAERFYKKSLKLERGPAVLSNLSTVYYAEKKYKKGKETYLQAFALNPALFTGDTGASNRINGAVPRDARAVMHYDAAKTFANAGKPDLAIDALRLAFDEGFLDRKRVLEDKEFATLREIPKFRRLVEESAR